MSQPLEALKEANLVRKKRADTKRLLKRDPGAIVDLVKDPPDYLHTMKVETLLMAIPYIGRHKAELIRKAARMSERTELGDLTAQRREEVAFVIRRYLPK